MEKGKYRQIQGRYPQLIQDSVPVVVAFTKLTWSSWLKVEILRTVKMREPKHTHDSRESCRSLFGKDPGDVQADIVRVIIIGTSIEYVTCLQVLISFIYWSPKSGEAVNMSTSESPSKANSDGIKIL
jgi:hypothetical protein